MDDLNERLKVRGAQRMRQAFRPDEAHAMLFNFDGAWLWASYWCLFAGGANCLMS